MERGGGGGGGGEGGDGPGLEEVAVGSSDSAEEATSLVVEGTTAAAPSHGRDRSYFPESSEGAAASEASAEAEAAIAAFAKLDLDVLEEESPLLVVPFPSAERSSVLSKGLSTLAGTVVNEGAPPVVTTQLWLDPHHPDPFVPDYEYFAASEEEDHNRGSVESEEEVEYNPHYTDDELLDVLHQLEWQPIDPPPDHPNEELALPVPNHRRWRGSPASSESEEASSSAPLELLDFGNDDEGAELPDLDSLFQNPDDFWNDGGANGGGTGNDDDPVDWEGIFDDNAAADAEGSSPPPSAFPNYGPLQLHPPPPQQSEHGVLQLLEQLENWELHVASSIPSSSLVVQGDLDLGSSIYDDWQWKAAAAHAAADDATRSRNCNTFPTDFGAYRTVDPTLISDDESENENNDEYDSLWLPNPVDDHCYDDESIPPSWYCQPCGAPPQQSFDEEPTRRAAAQHDLDAFLNAHPSEALQVHQETDFDELVQLSELLKVTALNSTDVRASAEGANTAVASEAPTPEPAHPDTMAESTNAAAPSAPHRIVRPEAERAVQFLLKTFQSELWQGSPTGSLPHPPPPPLPKSSSSPKGERLCLGHRERILGMDASECGRFLATASQEGSVRIWNIPTNALLHTLVHTSDNYECLRVSWASAGWGSDRLDRSESGSPLGYLLASGGADGRVQLWASPDPLQGSSWNEVTALDHSTYRHFAPTDDADKPQIYSLQFVDHWRALPLAEAESQNSFLLTSSDDHLHVWELDDAVKRSRSDAGDDVAAASDSAIRLREVFSLRFGHFHDAGYGVHLCQVTGRGLPVSTSCGHLEESGVVDAANAPPPEEAFFGGDRDPHRLVYVFDASYCRSNGLVAVALSDGSLRLLNGRGVCVTVLRLPGANPPHLTSFGWDCAGRRLATSVATGQVIAWDIDWNDGGGAFAGDAGASSYGVRAGCRAVLDGGHAPGRPIFGVAYCGTNGDVLLSWGSDGRLCAWDSAPPEDEDQRPADAALLSVLLHKADYPLYAVSLRSDGLAVAGGGSEPSFVGVPAYLYDFPSDAIPSPPPPPVVETDADADD